VTGLPTGGNVFASAGGVTKSIFVNVSADPNAPPLLQSMTITPASVSGGTNATGTVFLSAPAPAGGISVTLLRVIGRSQAYRALSAFQVDKPPAALQ
jgi:hypothetical protein